jgi:hypothetical protein
MIERHRAAPGDTLADWNPDLGLVPNWPEKGRYRKYSTAWDFIGYADEPQYPGQHRSRFPPQWTPYQCFLSRDWPDEVPK